MITLVFITTLVMWVLYYVVMGIKRHRPQLRKNIAVQIALTVFVYFCAMVDVFYNLTFGSLLFWQCPKEWLFTTRLERNLMGNPRGWRYKIANFICVKLLDPFDGGSHCGRV